MSGAEMTQIMSNEMTSSGSSQTASLVSSKPSVEAKPLIDYEDVTESSEEEKPSPVPSKETKTRAIIVRSIRPPTNHAADINILHKIKRDKRDLQDDYDDAVRELKSLGRENREQSIELRTLKKQHAQLIEAYRSRSEHGDSHRDRVQHEPDGFYEHVEELKDQIVYLKQELQRRKALVESLTVQTREANSERATAELNVKKLQKQNRDLSENLTECKDDLLRLQPPSVTPDSELAEQYSNLAQQIARWVDDETEDTQATEERFESLRRNEDLPEQLKPYLTDEHIWLGKKNPNAQPYILRYIIQCFLERCILGDDIDLFGLDSRTIALFDGIERGMHELEPPRDTITIRRWRSETLLGLTKMPDFRAEQLHQATTVSQSLHDLLVPLLPRPQTTSLQSLHETITLPALKLATALRLSTTDYRLWTRSSPSSSSPSRALDGKPLPIYTTAIQKASLIDMATNKILRQDSMLKVNEEGRIGEEMLIVTPSLLKVEREKGTSHLLVKPNVLVKLDEPMGRKGRIKGLGDWAGSWFGGTTAAVGTVGTGGEGGNP